MTASQAPRVIQSDPGPTALSALDLLVLARRGAAHEVNNLLGVIRGNTQLLPTLDADALRAVSGEIELACERLALLCDGWLLADCGLPRSGQCSRVAQAMRHVAQVVGVAHDAEIRISMNPSALQSTCGMDDRTLRALLYCALTSMLRHGHRSDVDIEWFLSDAGCTVHLHMACRVDHQPLVVAPGEAGRSVAERSESITTGLWDVAQCLGRHGGDLRHAHDCNAFHLWLDLPPPQA